MKKLKHGAHRGFTVVELIIVILIVAVLAGVGTIAYGKLQEQAKNTYIISQLMQYGRLLKAIKAKTGYYPMESREEMQKIINYSLENGDSVHNQAYYNYNVCLVSQNYLPDSNSAGVCGTNLTGYGGYTTRAPKGQEKARDLFKNNLKLVNEDIFNTYPGDKPYTNFYYIYKSGSYYSPAPLGASYGYAGSSISAGGGSKMSISNPCMSRLCIQYMLHGDQECSPLGFKVLERKFFNGQEDFDKLNYEAYNEYFGDGTKQKSTYCFVEIK